MTEVGLLVTGVLSTRQPIMLLSPEQQQHKLGIVEQKSISRQNNVIPQAQVTAPEFIQTEDSFARRLSSIVLLPPRRSPELPPDKLIDTEHASTVIQDPKKLLSLYQNLSRDPMPTLHFGSFGVSVRVLQRLLVANGYGIQIDGVFGPLTETAVKAFQSQRNLTADGVAGRRTWWELAV